MLFAERPGLIHITDSLSKIRIVLHALQCRILLYSLSAHGLFIETVLQTSYLCEPVPSPGILG